MQPEINTDYLGLRLSSPIIIGACTLTRQPEYVRELAIAGAGAVVLPSLFQEQAVEHLSKSGQQPDDVEQRAGTTGGSKIDDKYNGGPESYLRTIRELKHCVGIPIIANLDGFTDGNWLSFARDLQTAGADAIELNFHADCSNAGQSADEIENRLIASVCQVSDCVTIPVSVKLAPYFTSLANVAWRLVEAGATGVVIFAHEPIWETQIDRLKMTTNWALTPSGNVQPTLAGLIRVRAGGPEISVAASGGVSNPTNVIQVVIAGADVAMVTSEIYRRGPDVVAHMVDGMRGYLQRTGFHSFREFVSARPATIESHSQRLHMLQSLTSDEHYEDPTPHMPDLTGDQWGHLNR